MAKLIHFPRREQPAEECARWIAKMDRGLTLHEREELACWLGGGPTRRSQLLEMAKVYDDLDVLSELSGLVALPPPRAHAFRWVVPSLLAISAISAVSIVTFLNQGFLSEPSPVAAADPVPEHILSTAIGEYRSTRLADGSIVQLNTGTSIEIAFEPEVRRVSLERGEAQFNVEHDTDRPFVVSAGDYLIRAVGTAFNVRLLEAGGFEVTVTEGRIAIDSKVDMASGASEPTAYVDVGHSAHFDGTSHSIGAITDGDVQGLLAWQRGMLVFNGEPLEEALAEVTRHTGVRFEFADDAARSVRLGGYFKANDVEGLTQSLQENLSVRVRRVGPNLVIVSSGDD